MKKKKVKVFSKEKTHKRLDDLYEKTITKNTDERIHHKAVSAAINVIRTMVLVEMMDKQIEE